MEYSLQDHLWAAKFYDSLARTAKKQGKEDIASWALQVGFRHKQIVEQAFKNRLNSDTK